jgi:hypothetical protein
MLDDLMAKRSQRPKARTVLRHGHITLLIPLSVMCLRPLLGEGKPTVACTPSLPGASPQWDVLAKQLEHYLTTQTSLSNLVYLSLLCIGITLVVLSRKEKRPVEIQGIGVPLEGVYLAIAVIMTYLWVQYIWTLNHLLAEHCELWAALATDPAKYDRLRSALQSGPFVDAWVHAFRPEQAVGTLLSSGQAVARVVKWAVTGSILLGVAAAIGLAHACVFAILEDVPRRWDLTRSQLRWLNVARSAVCALIVCTYAWFELNNREWWFSILAAWFVFIWMRLRVLLPQADDAVLQAQGTPGSSVAAQ